MKTRNSNIELLRIIAASMILLNHIDFTVESTTTIGQANILLASFLHMGGKFGAILFAIISAYFLQEKSFDYKRIIKILVELFFYGNVLNLVDIFCFHKKLSLFDYIHGFIFWYPWAYMGMLILIPLMKRFLNDTFKSIILILGGLFSVIILIWGTCFTTNIIYTLLTNEIIIGPFWFAYLYLLMGHIFDKDKNRIKWSKNTSLLIGIISYLVIFGIALITDTSAIRDMTSPLVIIGTVAVFDYFLRTPLKESKVIGVIAQSTFGVYLIQCQYNTNPIWNEMIFKYDNFIESKAFILICIATLIVLYTLAIIMSNIYKQISKSIF